MTFKIFFLNHVKIIMYIEMDFEVILDWEYILKVPMLYLIS